MQNANNPLIFVLLTDQLYREKVVNYLKVYKFTNVETYLTGEEVLKNMSKNPDIVIQDYILEEMTEIELMTKAKKILPNVEFIFLSDKDNIDTAINCMKNGACDYIVKDEMALHKMAAKIQKINTASLLATKNSRFKLGVVLFFIVLGLMIIVTLVVMINQL
jgi:DNA-binding NarL/FixJ family response regulator